MSLPTTALYALRAVFDLAYHAQGGVAQLRELAQRQQIPVAYAEQVLRRLRTGQLVVAQRGRHGGYGLARPAAQVGLLEVLAAVGADPFAVEAERPDVCSRFLTDSLAHAREAIRQRNLQDLCQQAEAAGVPRAGTTPPMFFI